MYYWDRHFIDPRYIRASQMKGRYHRRVERNRLRNERVSFERVGGALLYVGPHIYVWVGGTHYMLDRV